MSDTSHSKASSSSKADFSGEDVFSSIKIPEPQENREGTRDGGTCVETRHIPLRRFARQRLSKQKTHSTVKECLDQRQ